MNRRRKRTLEIYYRSAQILHEAVLEISRILLPTYIGLAEGLILASLYLIICFNVAVGTFITLLTGLIFIIVFGCLKFALKYGSEMTEWSEEFARHPYSADCRNFTKADRVFFASCKPLILKVGHTFVITKETFHTISQDIVLGFLC
jgi:hypothetical protein